MKRATALIGMILAAATTAGADGSGRPVCAPRAALVRTLASQWSEVRVARAVRDGRLMELYANATTGSWSLLVTAPAAGGSARGRACLVRVGEGYRPEIVFVAELGA